jgi:hypothetical protein
MCIKWKSVLNCKSEPRETEREKEGEGGGDAGVQGESETLQLLRDGGVEAEIYSSEVS